MSPRAEYDEQKLKNLVVYISAQNDLSDKYGMTKLNKLLFFSDFTAYARLGRAISGAVYIKMPFGPCPKEISRAVEELKKESRIFSQKLTSGSSNGSRLRAIYDADIAAFSAPEISIVDEMIRRYWDLTGTQISDLSHEFVGWDMATLKEEIPYFTVFIPDAPLVPSAANLAEAHRRATAIFG